MRVRRVQYSPSGIFSDKICACNPLNRTAKVIRRSIAITACPDVSCAARKTEKKYIERFGSVYCDVRPLSKSRQHKLSRCCRLFGFFVSPFARGVCVVVCVFVSIFVFTSPFIIAYFCVGYYCVCCVRFSAPLRFRQMTRSRFLLFPMNVVAIEEELPSVFCMARASSPAHTLSASYVCSIQESKLDTIILLLWLCKFSQFLVCNPIFSSRIVFSCRSFIFVELPLPFPFLFFFLFSFGHTRVRRVYIRHKLVL